jgi:hypothetical protein
MREYVRDEMGRFADIPGVGNDAVNSATQPGGSRTSIPGFNSDGIAVGNEIAAANARRRRDADAQKAAEYKANTTPAQRKADLDDFMDKLGEAAGPTKTKQADIAAKKDSIAAKKADIEAIRGGNDPYRESISKNQEARDALRERLRNAASASRDPALKAAEYTATAATAAAFATGNPAAGLAAAAAARAANKARRK